MFDKLHPADNVNILCDYMMNLHEENVIYRGQIKDYNILIPSFYRGNILTGTNKELNYNYFIDFDEKIDDRRKNIKRITMNRLMKEFGKSLGNVFSQQYGISSECLDVTSDPHVAAFFATHSYPNYDSPIDSPDLGVIYRITVNHALNKVEYGGTELALSVCYLCDGLPSRPFLFSCLESQIENDEFDKLNQKYKFRLRNTYTLPIIYQASVLESLVVSYFRAKFPNLNIDTLYKNTRINRQKAGFIIPSFIFNSHVPQTLNKINVEGINTYDPSFVIHRRKIGLEDIQAYNGVEKYYFKHDSSIESMYSRDYLWPLEEDYFFNLLYKWCSNGCADYLKELSVEVDDQIYGIIDRGYY